MPPRPRQGFASGSSAAAALLGAGAFGFVVVVVSFPTAALAFRPSSTARSSSSLASSPPSSSSFHRAPRRPAPSTGRRIAPSFLRPKHAVTDDDDGRAQVGVGGFDPIGYSDAPPPPRNIGALASALAFVAGAAASPGAASAADADKPIGLVTDGLLPSGGNFNPETFKPVACPASDSFYSALQSATKAAVGPDSMAENAPIVASGLVRIRSELCVAEGYWNEALLPFVKANGVGSLFFPAHETAGTFLAGSVFALATAFLVSISSRLLQVVVFYIDAVVGGPSRKLGEFASDRVGGGASADGSSRGGGGSAERRVRSITDSDWERTRREMGIAVRAAKDAVSDAEAKLEIAKTRALFETEEGGDDIGDRADKYVDVQQQLQGGIAQAQAALDRAKSELDEKVKEQRRALQVEAEVASITKGERDVGGGQRGDGDRNPFFLVLSVVSTLVGRLIENVRRVVDAFDDFVARYLAGIVFGYVALKFVHFKFFPDAFSDGSLPDMSSLSLPQLDGVKEQLDAAKGQLEGVKEGAAAKLQPPALPDLDAIKESIRNKADSIKESVGDLPSVPTTNSESKIESLLPKAQPPPVTSETAPAAADAAASSAASSTTSAQDALESKIESFLNKPATPPEPPQPPPVEPPKPPITPPEPAPAADTAAAAAESAAKEEVAF